jgi:hypothetical protein
VLNDLAVMCVNVVAIHVKTRRVCFDRDARGGAERQGAPGEQEQGQQQQQAEHATPTS